MSGQTTWDEHQTEVPLERIIGSNQHRIHMAFKSATAAEHDYGLSLDDLVFITGLEKNSLSGPRLHLEQIGVIVRTEERRWNRNRTRKQFIYRLVIQ